MSEEPLKDYHIYETNEGKKVHIAYETANSYDFDAVWSLQGDHYCRETGAAVLCRLDRPAGYSGEPVLVHYLASPDNYRSINLEVPPTPMDPDRVASIERAREERAQLARERLACQP